MTGEISLPIWLFILLVALASLALLNHFLIPSARWYIRRRVNRVVDELNRRLRLRIKPFKLTRRQVLVDRLVYDPGVLEAVERHVLEEGVPREVVIAEARSYAREIVPSFNAYFYFRFGCWLAQRIAQSLYRVRLGYVDDEGHSTVPAESSVVFLMNHRSNIDYVLIAYLVSSRTALSYAVGEWARIWPLQTLIKAMGAYFIRRNSGDPLYRRVLERYVSMATKAGVVQAVYPEGGLTRDGLLRPPKLGLLSYMLSSFDPGGERDLVFIPVGVNYDRVLEDRSHVISGQPGVEQKSGLFIITTSARFILHNIGLMLRRRWHRLGYACVNFGTPVSMREYVEENGLDFREMEKEVLFTEVERLGNRLMSKVGEMIPVVPVSLIATVFLRRKGDRLSELELKSETHELIRELQGAGAHIYIPRSSQDYAVTVGLRMLTLRHIVEEIDGLYTVRNGEEPILQYYSNSIAHFLSNDNAPASS